MDSGNIQVNVAEPGDSDCSDDKCDNISTAAQEDNADCLSASGKPTIEKSESSELFKTTNVATSTVNKGNTESRRSTHASGDKFLSIADILLSNYSNRPKLKIEEKDQNYLSRNGISHWTHDDVKEMSPPSLSANTKLWSKISPDLLRSCDETRIQGLTTNHENQSSNLDGLLANFSSTMTCDKRETRPAHTPISSPDDNDQDRENSRSGPLAKAGNYLPCEDASSAEGDDPSEIPRSVVSGLNVPRLPHVPDGSHMWLGQALWRQMWQARLAASYPPLTGVCLPPYSHSISPVILQDGSSKRGKLQSVLAAGESPSFTDMPMEQEEEQTNVHQSAESLKEDQPREKNIDNIQISFPTPSSSSSSSELDRPTSPSPPTRPHYQVSVGSRRRRRQRQAYSAVQLSTLEGEFKMNRYLSSEKREALSHKLSLSENQVKAWFQNRRTKDKKQQASQGPAMRPKEDQNGDSRRVEGQLGAPYQVQPGSSGLTSTLLLPPQTPSGADPPGLVWSTGRHRQLVPQMTSLGLMRPPVQTRALALDVNTTYAAQASNYLALLQRIL